MVQGSYGSGVRFFTLLNGIDDSKCVASFSFDYDFNNIDYSNNLIIPDSWNIYSATGILNADSQISQTGLYKTDQFTGILDTFSHLYYKIDASNNNKTIIVANEVGPDFYDGYVYIYKQNNISKYVLDQKLQLTGTSGGINLYNIYPSFGTNAKISKDGKVIMVGSISGPGNNGNIWVYTGNLNSKYELKKLINFDAPALPLVETQTYSFYISDDNNTLIIGNPLYSPVRNGSTREALGGVFIYTGSTSNGWELKTQIEGSGSSTYFGNSIIGNTDASALMIYENQFVGGVTQFLNKYNIYTGKSTGNYNKIQQFVYPQATGISAFNITNNSVLFWESIPPSPSITSGYLKVFTGLFNNFGISNSTFVNFNEVGPVNNITVFKIDDQDLSFYGETFDTRFNVYKYKFNSFNNKYSLDNLWGAPTGNYRLHSNEDFSKIVAMRSIDDSVYPTIHTFETYEYLNNNIGNFLLNSGLASFNGNTLLSFDPNLSLYRTDPRSIIFNSTLFLTFEKQRQQNEILVSSLGGNSFSNYSGFCLGVNDANKLYFKYWNPIDGPFSYTFPNILANKNSIYLQTQQNEVTIGLLNNNTKTYDIKNFTLFRNRIKDSNNFVLGGSQIFPEWLGGNITNFSGLIDNFYLFRNLSTLDIKNITSGFIYNPIAINGIILEECFTESILSGSGFLQNEVTGKELVTGITGDFEVIGVLTGFSGITGTGITGYEAIETQRYIDNCGNEIINYRYDPLTGIIITNVPFNIELTGYVERTGIFEIDLTGLVENFIDVEINRVICNERLLLTGIPEFTTGIKFLSGLSFSEISLISKLDNEDSLEAICENYTHDTLLFNRSLDYDNFNKNHYYNENINITGINQIMLFANGQALINSGFYVQEAGYDTNIITNLDYAVSGNDVYTNKKFDGSDYLFYDYITGNFLAFKTTGTIKNGETIINLSGDANNKFIFLNGQKLIKGLDYSLQSQITGFKINAVYDLSGSNYFIIKHFPHDFNNYLNTGDNLIFNNQWLFKQKFSGNNSIDNFGSSVVSNDNANIIVIGELNDANVGSASIFTGNSNVGWEFKQKITGSGAGSNFGYSLASSKNGNIIIMGGPEYDPLPASQYLNAGGVAIFTGSFNTNWVLKQIITGDTIGTVSNQNDKFGYSVTTNNDGSVIIVGVPSDNIRDLSLWPSTINDIGSAMIFTGNAINGWNFRQKITGNFIGSFFNFGYGYCVATNNDSSIIAMSGPSYSAFGNVAIFTGNAINGWNLKQIVSGNRAGGGFGESMSMNNNGDILVVGQPSFDVLSVPSIGNPGSILIFTGNAINGWKLKQDITGDWASSTQGDLFGNSLSINENGNIITVAAPLEDSLGPGSINIFSGNINDGWKSIQKIYNVRSYSLTNNNDGDIIIAGSQYDMINNITQAGSASIYKLSRISNSGINTNGTLKINSNFNHGCSQVYFNGIRQKINNNYIENSDFDLLSGSFNESDLKQDIYSNTDNFFVKI
jgi:hypothetical protein